MNEILNSNVEQRHHLEKQVKHLIQSLCRTCMLANESRQRARMPKQVSEDDTRVQLYALVSLPLWGAPTMVTSLPRPQTSCWFYRSSPPATTLSPEFHLWFTGLACSTLMVSSILSTPHTSSQHHCRDLPVVAPLSSRLALLLLQAFLTSFSTFGFFFFFDPSTWCSGSSSSYFLPKNLLSYLDFWSCSFKIHPQEQLVSVFSPPLWLLLKTSTRQATVVVY